MEVTRGWSILIPSGPGRKKHLFFVLNEVEDKREWSVVLAPVSSMREKGDSTCILKPGDHPFIKHKSFVEYGQCRTDSLTHLEQQVKSGNWERKDDASQRLIERIIDGLFDSPQTKPRIQKLI